MELTKNGISTTIRKGQFAYDEYYSISVGGMRVQWDYRDTNGKLYSGIAPSIEQAKMCAEYSSGEKIDGV